MYQFIIILLADTGCPSSEKIQNRQYIFLEHENPRSLPCYYISLTFIIKKYTIFEMLNKDINKNASK